MAKSKKTDDPIETTEELTPMTDVVESEVEAVEAAPSAPVVESQPDDAPSNVDDAANLTEISIPEVAAVLGTTTGNAETRLRQCNDHERAQIAEAQAAGNRRMVLVVIKNAMNRIAKPKLPLGKK